MSKIWTKSDQTKKSYLSSVWNWSNSSDGKERQKEPTNAICMAI